MNGKTTVHVITFYGRERMLRAWRDIIGVYSAVTAVSFDMKQLPGRFCFTAMLTNEQRQAVQEQYWYADAETEFTDAQGRPLKWNDCIAFSETDA